MSEASFSFSNFFSAAYNIFSSGIPQDPFEPAPLSESQLRKDTFQVHKDGGNMKVYVLEPEKKYHVTIFHEKLKKTYSVYRCANPYEACGKLEKFEKESVLIGVADNEETFKQMIREIHQHPEWNSAHIAAKLNVVTYFDLMKSDSNINRLMSEKSKPDGFTAFHLAIQNNNPKCIEKIVIMGADPALTDNNGNNGYHYAAKISGEVVKSLGRSNGESINQPNASGLTPLFVALEALKEDCVAALLDAGATPDLRCNGRTPLTELMASNNIDKSVACIKTLLNVQPELANERDAHSGDTAFHLAKDKKILSLLLDVVGTYADMNVRNKAGQTPLHIHAFRGDLSASVLVMSYGADPNAQDNKKMSPLHFAVVKNKLDLVRALLIFGADPNLVSEEGHSALHLTATLTGDARSKISTALLICGAVRCQLGKSGCLNTCNNRPTPDNLGDLSLDSASNTPKTVDPFDDFCQNMAIDKQLTRQKQNKGGGKSGKVANLLALDGGGIRGLILIQILFYLETMAGEDIMKYFDWLAGTSTGSILAGGIAKGKTLRQCQQLYFRFKDIIFKGFLRPYDSQVLETFMKKELGEKTSLADITSRRLLITAVDAQYNPLKLKLFRNYTIPCNDQTVLQSLDYTDPKDTLLWKACRCSSAAPSYFTSVDGRYVDGGLISNNPTMELLIDVHRYNTAMIYQHKPEAVVEIGCVVSIGTGRLPDMEIKNIGFGAPEGILDALMKSIAVKDMANVLIEQVTATEGAPVERSRAWSHMLGVPYFRFSTRLSKDIPMDTKDDLTLINMLWETIEYMNRNRKDAENLIQLLKN